MTDTYSPHRLSTLSPRNEARSMDRSKLVIVGLILLAVLYIGTVGLGIKNNGRPSGKIDKQQIKKFKTENPGSTGAMDGLGSILGGIAPALKPGDLSTGQSTLSPLPGKTTFGVTINPSDDKIRFARLFLAAGNQAKITYQPKTPNSMKLEEKKSVTLYRQRIDIKPVARPTGPIHVTTPLRSGRNELSHRRVAESATIQSGQKLRDKLMIYREGGTLRVDCSGCQVRLEN